MAAKRAVSIEAQYAAALARAEAEGVVVYGKGTRKSDGATVYGVTSATEANRVYLVTVLPGRLACACQARGMCKHRAAARKRIMAEMEETASAAATARAAQSALAAAAARRVYEAQRATAPLHRDNAPVSMWRA